nr:xylulose kinase-1 [Tanacetum cinerariifolium]
MIKVLPPKTAKEVVAKEKERKARTTLLMALPKDHLAKFHNMVDAKEMWEAIKSWFGGNDESKKIAEIDAGYNGNKARDNGKRHAYQDDLKSLVTIDEEDIDWLKKLYDEERDKLGNASVEITAYTLALKKSVFMNKESDLEDTPVNDRYAEGMHAVPSPMTGNYMPSRPDLEIDYSKFTYGPKQTLVDESDSKPSESVSCESDSSVETSTSMPKPVESAPKVVCEPKVWTDAPIIKEYESYSDDDSVSNVQEEKERLSFAFTDTVKHKKTTRENVKETGTPNHSPNIKKQDRNGHIRKCLGYAFTRKSCFVCSSFSHFIRDCDFHEKRMAKQAALTKSKNKVTGQRENTPVWNNVQRVNHQNIKELASPKQTALGKDISNTFMAGSLPKTKWVLALEQSKTAQDLVIKKLQKKVKRIKRKIKARTPRMTLFKIGNFRRKSLDKENVSKHGRYLKTMLMFEESDFDNIDDTVDEDND